MSLTLPLQFLLLTFVGWVNREHQKTIEYLKEENRVLRDKLGSAAFASRTAIDEGSPARAKP